MNRSTKSINDLILTIIALAILSVGNANADSLTVVINNGAVVANADGSDLRLYLGFDLPSEIVNNDIVFAELRVPLTSIISDSSALMINCNPLLQSWNPNEVQWNDLGDSLTSVVIGAGTAFATTNNGAVTAYFDITEIVRAWNNGEIPNNGLLLSKEMYTLPTFSYTRGENAPFAALVLVHEQRAE